MEIRRQKFSHIVHEIPVRDQTERKSQDVISVGIDQRNKDTGQNGISEKTGFPLGLFLFLPRGKSEFYSITKKVNRKKKESCYKPPMQIDPEEHDRGQQIQIIPGAFLKYFQYLIPSNHDYHGKNVGPCQPVKSGGNDYDGNDQNIGNDVPSAGSQHSEEQGVGSRNQENKKKDHAGEI